jgi:hypothetical protein
MMATLDLTLNSRIRDQMSMITMFIWEIFELEFCKRIAVIEADQTLSIYI